MKKRVVYGPNTKEVRRQWAVTFEERRVIINANRWCYT
jgi:hypothetical protein